MSTRRDFLQNAGVIGVGLLVNQPVGHTDLSTAMSAGVVADSIVMMDGVSLSKAIHSKEVSCREVRISRSHRENQSEGECNCIPAKS